MNNKTIKIKQTATEWLFHKLWDTPKDKFNWYALLKKAEEMHEKQIKDAFEDGCISEMYELNAQYTAEKYYNKTYDKGEPKR